MRIRKRSVPLPFSSLCPTIPPDFQLHKVPSMEEDSKNRLEAAPDEQPQETKGSTPEQQQKQQPHEGDSSSVAVKEEIESSHLDYSNFSSPLPFNHEVNRNRRSSDLQLTIVRVKNGWICSDAVEERGVEPKNTMNEKCSMCPNTPPSQAEKGSHGEDVETKGKRWRVLFNNAMKASSLDAEANDETGANGLLSSSSSQVERWCEGEKAFPLKKRRGSFDRKAIEETTMRTILKTITNKGCVHPEINIGNKGEEEEEEEERIRSSNGAKKRGSHGGVQEGSRCSRVNGRGWRCCQQTLVGYSLCEHHLGKGRLRSMNTVRNHASSVVAGEVKRLKRSPSSPSSIDKNDWLDDEEEEEEEKPAMSTKKRKKIGMVKARSISSLLFTSSVVNGNNGGIV